MNKIILLLTFASLAACSSSSKQDESGSDHKEDNTSSEELLKAQSPGTGLRIKSYVESPKKNEDDSLSDNNERPCKTPLGIIAHGRQKTGYAATEVAYGEVCISDPISCDNGKWTGKGIHPTCRVAKPPVTTEKETGPTE